VLRPKAKSAASAQRLVPLASAPAGPAVLETQAATELKKPPAPPQLPSIVKVRPSYPRWFEPAASFAERRPKSALAGVILTLAVTFGVGILLGMLLK
jgi:eukaryotic-like serine/threonine-protein kinase